MENVFYIIWSPQGKTPPSVRISRRWKAEEIATSMARKYPGQDFFVMKSKSNTKVEIPEPQKKIFGSWQPKAKLRLAPLCGNISCRICDTEMYTAGRAF